RARGLLLAVAFLLGRFGLLVLLGRCLGNAVSDVVHNVQPRDAALVEEVHRVRFLLAEDRHQHVSPGYFLLARRLHVQDRPLDDALEALRGLGVGIRVRREPGRMLVDEVGQHAAQLFQVDAASLQHFGRRRVVEHREQQVLDSDEFVLLLPGLDKSHVKGDFQFLRNHSGTFFTNGSSCRCSYNAYVSSMVHWSGCWCLRAILSTWSTFAAATSRVYVPHTPIPSLCTCNITCVAFSRLIANTVCNTTTTKSIGV